jgi:hypothetical protein
LSAAWPELTASGSARGRKIGDAVGADGGCQHNPGRKRDSHPHVGSSGRTDHDLADRTVARRDRLRRVVESEQLTADPEFGASTSSLISVLRSLVASSSSDAGLAALRQLQHKVAAKRGERTYVVELMVDTTDPEKSARLANAIAQAYLDEQTAARADAARRATDSMSARLSELRERVRQAEEQVERYKKEHNIVNASGRLVDDQQLTDLNNQLTTATARAAEAKARYEQIVRLQRSGADPGAIAEAVQSTTIGRLREMVCHGRAPAGHIHRRAGAPAPMGDRSAGTATQRSATDRGVNRAHRRGEPQRL